MRLAWLLLALTACDDTPPLPRDCPRACRPDDLDCTDFPYERLPARCFDICSLGECCELMSGAWNPRFFDCARPADAGVGTPPDGAPDA
jgi:hypothetical protein